MKTQVQPLAPDQLTWRCDRDLLAFESTADLPPLEGLVGQNRALSAIELGLGVDAAGYNIYVAGPSGSGRTATVHREAARIAQLKPAPDDWCYIYNFQVPYRPTAVSVPTGKAPELAHDVNELFTSFGREIPKVFEGEAFQKRRAELVRAAAARHDETMTELSQFATAHGFSLQVAPGQVMTVPLKPDSDETMTTEEFERLPAEARAELQARNRVVHEEVDQVFATLRRLDRDTQAQVQALDREFAEAGVGHYFAAMRAKYAAHPDIVGYLTALQTDLVDHLEVFRESGSEGDTDGKRVPEGRYAVNMLVTNGTHLGAPIVFEPNPTYYNLVGRIDFRSGPGVMATDLTMIKPGALHRANGGFLIIQARDLLLSPGAWEALKRSLRDREIRIENLFDQLSPIPTTTLRPEPIPLSVKVILIGDLSTYLVLYQMDPEFSNLFKVKAQFTTAMERTPESILAIAAFVSGQVSQQGTPPFSRDAVARIVEYAGRLAEDQERLATRFDALAELVAEAGYWAKLATSPLVSAEHVVAALRAKEYRVSLAEDEVRRVIGQGTIAIDTESDVVGQVNGLSIIDLGDHVFGHPSRITATVGIGEEGVINIEREAHLSGPTHSKGVLILTGYLRDKYAGHMPLALSASLAFEQNYGGVDGDSASGAELCALLSALAEVPIHQGIAMTGSINQRGEIQAVGGVTRKIEGFFDVCRSRGLSGQHGVILPEANVRHLVLRQDVVDAVEQGQFRMWAIRSVDEALELLTGLAAGSPNANGVYPKDTVHGRVQRRLEQMASDLTRYRGDGRLLRPAGKNDGATPAIAEPKPVH